MIKKFNHKNIDRKKYTSCIQQSMNYRIYAELWYLSIVSPDGYDILVLNDYEAVMPIPYQKKWRFKFVCQPTFCQQLGIFYPEKISSEYFTLFFFCLKKYKVRSYNFNEENTEYFPPTQERRNNQILFLYPSYNELYSHFYSGRKSEVKKINNSNFIIKTQTSFTDIYELLQDQNLYSNKQIKIIKTFMNESIDRNLIHSVSVQKENLILGCIVFLISKNRIINLLSVRNYQIPEQGIITFILNQIIQEFSNSDKILDFEGSMIPGVAWFNKSLGAIDHPYVSYKNFIWFETIKKLFQ